MSKILEATCAAGVVSVDGIPVPGTTILSEGIGTSAGVLLMQGETLTYIPKITPDLSTTLEKLADALGQLVTALSVIDVKPVGGVGSAPAPAAATSIAQLTAIQLEVTALKEMLK